jgi:hypothetical protein
MTQRDDWQIDYLTVERTMNPVEKIRAKAAEFKNHAASEPNPLLASDWERTSESYLRAAAIAERLWLEHSPALVPEKDDPLH